MADLKVTVIDNLVFSEATVLMGSRRARLIVQTYSMEDEDKRLAAASYANLQASCVKGDLPPFEAFCQMSERDIERWLNAVYHLNPHWAGIAPETVEKKETS